LRDGTWASSMHVDAQVDCRLIYRGTCNRGWSPCSAHLGNMGCHGARSTCVVPCLRYSGCCYYGARCFAVAVDDLIAAVQWALWLAIELLVLLATLLRGIRHRFGKDTRGILNTLYWDALKFALLMTGESGPHCAVYQFPYLTASVALSITSVVSTFTLPPSYKTATASLQRVMHSILASHVLLRLRRKVSEMPPVQASTTQTGFWVDSIAGYQIVSKDKSEVEA